MAFISLEKGPKKAYELFSHADVKQHTVEPRLSGVFDYPDFFPRSQSFHEY